MKGCVRHWLRLILLAGSSMWTFSRKSLSWPTFRCCSSGSLWPPVSSVSRCRVLFTTGIVTTFSRCVTCTHTLKPVNQLINQSIGPSGYWSIGPSVYRSIDLSAYRSIGLSVHRSIGLLVHRSIGPSVDRSIGPSVHRAIGPSVDRSIGPSIHRSIGPSVNQSIGPSGHQSINPSLKH